MMLSRLTRFAKRLWARLSTAAHQVFRHLTQPASSNLVTGTLADLPRRRSELLAENALLRQQLIVLRRQVRTPQSRMEVSMEETSLLQTRAPVPRSRK